MREITKVCLIDDDDIYQFLLKKELKNTKIVDNTMIFSNGAKAMDFIANAKDEPDELPDVIFLDINMPIMNGWQFLDEFVQMRPRLSKEITILIITSSFDPRDMERAKQYSEISDYIVKPVTRDHLVEVLKSL